MKVEGRTPELRHLLRPSSSVLCKNDVSTSASKAHIHIRLAIGLVIAGLIAIIATAVLLIGFLSAAERLEWRSIGSVAELQRAEPVLLAIDNHEFYLIWLDVTPSALST